MLPCRKWVAHYVINNKYYIFLFLFWQENFTVPKEELFVYPKLLGCGEVRDEQLQYFLILDKEYIDVGKCFLKAFDILYKSYYVFNVEYPKTLDIFYNFMDHIIYKVNTGAARSSVEHLNTILCNIKTDTWKFVLQCKFALQ